MADKKISEMTTASQVNDSDNIELSQGSGTFTSVKASILAIATKILTGINFTSALQTTDKTVIGAINEVSQGGGGGGSSTLAGLTDVAITSVSNGQMLKFDTSSNKWINVNAPSSGTWTDVTGTLVAGQTSITLSDASITTTSTIEVFNDLDVPYNSKTVSTGSITLTFDEQASNMNVKVRVS